jgi:MFS transporter, ACDE family, multidrug resistance protein
MTMKETRLRYLFMTNLVILFVGYGLFPFLPLYAMEFGASTGTIGLYLGLTYVAISTGSMLPSWLPARLSRKKLFLAGSILGAPALFLLGIATELWQVMILTAIVWFSGGVGLALSSVYTGLLSRKQQRGRSFSLVALSTPIASLLGGLLVGQLVTWQGYRFMFIAVSLWWVILPLVVLFKLDDIRTETTDRPGAGAAESTASSPGFLLLLLAALLAAGTVSIGRMGASIVMEARAFSPAAVGNTTAIAGAAMIPVVLLMGALSDRMGRQRFLMLGYLLTAAGAAALAVSGQLWHFWVAMSLLMTGRAVNDSMAAAVATDLLPRAAVHRGLPRLKAMNWVAGVASFAGGGYAIEALGVTAIFVAGALIALVAVGALVVTPAPPAEESITPVVPLSLSQSPAGVRQ